MMDLPTYSPRRPVAQRQPRMKDRAYLNWVAAKGVCEACGVQDGTIVPAHYRPGRLAMGMKPDDDLVAGLCRKCHDDESAHPGPAWWAEHVLTRIFKLRYQEWVMAR